MLFFIAKIFDKKRHPDFFHSNFFLTATNRLTMRKTLKISLLISKTLKIINFLTKVNKFKNNNKNSSTNPLERHKEPRN